MPTCGTLLGRYEPCKQFVGGLKGAFFVPFEFANAITTDGSGLVTQINNGATTTRKINGLLLGVEGFVNFGNRRDCFT